jgi:hypothetical protein
MYENKALKRREKAQQITGKKRRRSLKLYLTSKFCELGGDIFL